MTYAAVTWSLIALFNRVTHGPTCPVVAQAGKAGVATQRGRLSTPAYADSAAGRFALMYTGSLTSRL